MELSVTIVNGKPLTIFTNSSILDIWRDSEYSPDRAVLICDFFLFHQTQVAILIVLLIATEVTVIVETDSSMLLNYNKFHLFP